MRPIALVLCAALALAAPAGASATAASAGEARTARALDLVRGNPAALARFLRRFPKGGDLHNHLSGAIYAESFIGWAASDGLCVDQADLTLVAPPCDPAQGRPTAVEAARTPALRGELIDAFSMRDFKPVPPRFGHDHFFDAFARFDLAGKGRDADMLAEARERAAANRVDYLELMWSPGMAEARAMAAETPWSDDLQSLADAFAPQTPALVAKVRAHIDAVEARSRQILHCGSASARPGCRVDVRYLAQVIRTFPPAQVFAQSQFGYALAAADPRVVGVNLVAPEDDPVTLRDYDKQMRLLGFLGARYPAVRLTLHAGELSPGLAPAADLRFHIREAVEVAGARRIGHGVDLPYEDDPASLLRTMAERHVLVEINLSSNDEILGVKGKDHPFMAYRQAGVPVALSTDDAGVSRIDLTREYVRAVQTYGLTYRELKTLARNSLEYAFLPGESLWADTSSWRPEPACASGAAAASRPSAACRALLARSAKARGQWRLEAEFRGFEAGAGRPAS